MPLGGAIIMLNEITEQFIIDLKNESLDKSKATKNFKSKPQRPQGKEKKVLQPIQLLFDKTKEAINNIDDLKKKELLIESISRNMENMLSLFKGNLSVGPFEVKNSLNSILDNVRTSLQQIEGIQSLPPEAVVIQGEAGVIIKPSLQKTESAQTAAIDFIAVNNPKLEEVKKELENPAIPLETIIEHMGVIGINANTLKIEVDSLNTNATLSEIGALSAQSIALEANFNTQVSELENLIRDAEKRRAEAESNRWYWLLLGPFGVAGVIAVAIIITNINNEIDELTNRIIGYKQNFFKTKELASCVSYLGTSYQELYGQVGFLKNEIDFIIGEINNIIQNLKNPEVDRDVVVLYVVTTLDTMKQLEEYVG